MTRLRANFSKRHPGGFEVSLQQFQPKDGIAILFGSSGSGKTTILRCLAGLEKPDTGEIHFENECWFGTGPAAFVAPEKRGIGYVPQDYALFPHLTVAENVEYGLHNISSSERKRQAGEALEWLRISPLASRLPHRLSGGEQQRAALARAVARQPRLLLLDEPLSALDTPTRQRVRSDLSRWLAALKLPTILVTHDRLEASVMGSEIFVLGAGKILQHGNVTEVFSHPASLEVAQLTGTDTVLGCEVLNVSNDLATLAVGAIQLTALVNGLPPGSRRAHVCIRAEDVVLSLSAPTLTSSRNHLAAVVERIENEGGLVRVHLDCGFKFCARLTHAACEELSLIPGARVSASVKASQLHAM